MSLTSTNNISESYKNDFVKISEAYDKYVVIPLNAFGIAGFVFDVEGSTRIIQESAITDNYVEDNTAVQDQIAVRPKEIHLKRYVGELIYEEKKNALFEFISSGVKELTIISGLLPAITQAMEQAQALIDAARLSSIDGFLNAGIDLGTNIWSLVQDLNPFATRQQKAYLFLSALQEKGILVSVQTPFEYLSNMAIKNLISEQPEESKFISTFEITFKQIRKAETAVTNVKADRAGEQAQIAKTLGKIDGDELGNPDEFYTDWGNYFLGIGET